LPGLNGAGGVEKKGNEYVLLHRCQKCGKLTKNKTSPQDGFEHLLELTQKG